jgi:hypothetical protein
MHTIGGTLGDVGSGMGGLFTGLAPVPIYGALIKHGAEPVSGALKRAGKEVGGSKMGKKVKKKIAKRKAKKKR